MRHQRDFSRDVWRLHILYDGTEHNRVDISAVQIGPLHQFRNAKPTEFDGRE
jgi:hypothetical protein